VVGDRASAASVIHGRAADGSHHGIRRGRASMAVVGPYGGTSMTT
jgi:hypothetical protein